MINISLLEAVLGRLLTVYGLILMIPALIALFSQDPWSAVAAFALTGLITTLLGIFLKTRGHLQGRMGVREGFAAVAGSWVLASVIGSFPLYFSGSVTLYINALFESTSGFTTTGASILSTIETLPNSILLWRSMTHWLGGMGIIVLFIVLLPNLGIGAMHLFKAEVPGPTSDKVLPKIRDEALVLWMFYSVFTLLAIILLKLAGMSFFDAVNHGFATLATGGFSTRTESIAAYNSFAVELIIIVFMIMAGINFNLYIQAFRKEGLKVFVRDMEFRIYLLILLGAVLIIASSLILQGGFEIGTAFRQSMFQTVSITTTTGFATADFNQWPGLAKTMLFFLMFVGGSAGSTSGGIKIARVMLLGKMALNHIKEIIHPRLVSIFFVQNRKVDPLVLSGVARFFFLFVLCFGCASILLAATGLEPFDAMSAAIAALGNIGPGFGIVGPASNFAAVNSFGKLILIFCMLLGRLELFTLLVFLQPEFWRPTNKW